MYSDPTKFLDWALQALAFYPLEQPKIRFIRHNENLTFQVSDQHKNTVKRYLLRLHFPKSINFITMDGGLRQKPMAIESEMCLLEALGQNGDLRVQTPVRNINGGLVTILDGIGGQPTIPVSMLEWLEGEPLIEREPYSPAIARSMGILSAKLHESASHWQPPQGFLRPRYGTEYLIRIENNLASGIPQGSITPENFAILQECLHFIRQQQLDTSSWGLVHADLHAGNILVLGTPGDELLSPIDFSLCGFGDALFDVGPTMITLPSELRMDFLKGYRSICPIDDNELSRAEGLAMAAFLSYCALVVPVPAEQEWLKKRIPQVTANECQKMLRGESFLFTM